MEYRPIPGSKLNKDEAQIVGSYLEQLGSFTPSDVVAAARPETSPLHKHFTWDDIVAAEKYRLQEARQLVNHISVIVTVAGKQQVTRAFHSIAVESANEEGEAVPERRYTAIKMVSQSQDMRDQVIQRAAAELEGWQQRYDQYQEVFGANIFEEIKRVTTRVRKRAQLQPQPAA